FVLPVTVSRKKKAPKKGVAVAAKKKPKLGEGGESTVQKAAKSVGYRLEDRATKKERLVKRAQAKAEGKTPKTMKSIIVKKMEIPYCIVKGKEHLGVIVHKKTASAHCLTTVKNEYKMEFNRILEAIKTNVNEQYKENRKKWGGGIMGSKLQAMTKAKERVLSKEASQRLN
ncbi:60S ribosomal protein L7A, partial [Datura stramonium]|nr:60S ribosomal protein L7A [Datura stramonium]